MCRKKLLLSVFLMLSSLSMVFAASITSSVWLGAKVTSTYPTTITYGVNIDDEFLLLSLEQIGTQQTQFTTDLNFKNNKTLRQEVNFSSLLQYDEWFNTNISYMLGQDLYFDFYYLKYRIGLQLGFNYVIPLKHMQHALNPTLYIDTGFDTKYIKLGLKLGSITNTETTLQPLPIINPYLSFPIQKWAINLGTEIKLSDYLPDKIYPIISIATRIGISYTGGER